MWGEKILIIFHLPMLKTDPKSNKEIHEWDPAKASLRFPGINFRDFSVVFAGGVLTPAAIRRLPVMPYERRDQRTGESDFRMRVRLRDIHPASSPGGQTVHSMIDIFF